MLELDVIPERSLGYSGNTISGGTWEFILGLFIESLIFLCLSISKLKLISKSKSSSNQILAHLGNGNVKTFNYYVIKLRKFLYFVIIYNFSELFFIMAVFTLFQGCTFLKLFQ